MFLKKFPWRLLCLVGGNSFFQSTMFLCFTKVVAVIHSLMDMLFFKRALPAWQIFESYWVNSQFQLQPSIPLNDPFFLYKRTIAATHSFRFTVFAEQELKQGDIIVTNYNTSLVSEVYILKEVCYLTTLRAAIHFFCSSVIISREHLKRSICHGQRVFFTIHVATIQYNKRLEESHCSPAFLRSPIYSTELVAVIFIWKILC